MTDLISRADAIDALEDNKSDWDNDYNRPIEKDIQAIKALPSAETTGALDDAIAKYVADGLMELPSAEAVQGEWIITKEGEYDGRSVYKTVCSECGHETFYKANKAHFCPKCGCVMDMRGGDEECL